MELIEAAFQWPNTIPSVLMTMAVTYWVLVIIGALDIELFDFDFDGDGDVDGDGLTGVSGLGLVVLRALNIGQVPLMIWGSVFAIAFWLTSMLLWDFWDNPETSSQWVGGSLLLLRNVVVAAVIAKLVTNPMKKWFRIDRGLRPEQMIGERCELTTPLRPGATGQARFQTSAAPRLLNVRIQKGDLAKGDVVELTGYEPETKTFWVKQPEDEV